MGVPRPGVQQHRRVQLLEQRHDSCEIAPAVNETGTRNFWHLDALTGDESCQLQVLACVKTLQLVRKQKDGLGTLVAPSNELRITVRCPECEPKQPAAARYCECCGHELSDHGDHHEMHSAAAPTEQSSDLYDWAPSPNRTSDLRCPTCAGPSFDGNRCQACREQATVQRTQSVTPPLAPDPSESAAPANVETHHAHPETEPPQIVEKPTADRAKTVEPEVKTQEIPTRRPTAADAVYAEKMANYAEKMAKPAVPLKRPVVPQPQPAPVPVPAATRRPQPPAALVAAGAAVLALAAGGYWFGVFGKPAAPRVQQPVAVVPTENPADADDAGVRPVPAEHPETPAVGQDRDIALPKERPTAPVAAPAAPPPDRNATPSKARPVASTSAIVNRNMTAATSRDSGTPVRPKQAAAPTSRQPAATLAADKQPIRPQASNREVLVAPVRASGPAVTRPAVDVGDTRPMPAASASPVGPIFDIGEVNESPRITTRAEPRLPAELRRRSTKEVVVVRALVSQSGRPSRISLLRRSKAGPELDDVVLESVNRWTFSPARKKGAPVNCWFNFAVEVGGTD
jgi:TonB family protein